ncbi:MAG: glutathione S-transferase N-terminal domain-containing protein [Pseudomonadota bacterium]
MNERHILWGMPVSLYTGKVRSYLLTQGIPFEERLAGPDFIQNVVPNVGRWIIPVLETPSGDLVQDGAAIIDGFEAEAPRATPDMPVARAVSALFELFGGEGLLRAAMHYRWSFDDQNLDFIRDEFTLPMQGVMPPDQIAPFFESSSGRMRKAGAMFGVSAETAPLVEESYGEFLSLFSAHLAETPFLLGDRPSRGDYGLIAPLYAHLGRDPAPAHLMKRTAPRVFRWTERMNRPVVGGGDGDFRADVPETLKALMRFIADDYLPELGAHVAFANDWLAKHPDIEPGTNGQDDPTARGIGMATFDWRGTQLTTAVMPYRFWLLQKLQAAAGDDADVRALFAETGLEAMLDLKTARPVERKNHLEVWG